MTTRKPIDLPARPGTPTTEKTVVTFRFPGDLGHWLQDEAERRGWSMNELMVTIAHDFSTWFGLPPEPVAEQLEADEKALGVDRRRYLQRVLMARYHQVLEKGPGFEKKPGAHAAKRG